MEPFQKSSGGVFSFCLYSTKTVIELWLRVISLELMKGVAADQQLDLKGRMKKKRRTTLEAEGRGG